MGNPGKTKRTRSREKRTTMILADSQIRELCQNKQPMIEPFAERTRGHGIISYGLSSYGYDFRIGSKFKVFHNLTACTIDPKEFDQSVLQDRYAESVGDNRGHSIIIPPNSFALGVSVEYFRIPSNVISIGIGKSTLARCGMILNVTPLEPSWEGHLTVELSNTTPCPMRVYANEGIGQLLFFRGAMVAEVNYAMKQGKYQGQMNEVTLPKVEK
jgi:dCTP deaminase